MNAQLATINHQPTTISRVPSARAWTATRRSPASFWRSWTRRAPSSNRCPSFLSRASAVRRHSCATPKTGACCGRVCVGKRQRSRPSSSGVWQARHDQVKVRYGDFTTLTRQLSVEDPLTEAKDMYRPARRPSVQPQPLVVTNSPSLSPSPLPRASLCLESSHERKRVRPDCGFPKLDLTSLSSWGARIPVGRKKLVSRPLRLLGLEVSNLREPTAQQLVLLFRQRNYEAGHHSRPVGVPWLGTALTCADAGSCSTRRTSRPTAPRSHRPRTRVLRVRGGHVT